MSGNFRHIVVCDFEYELSGGEYHLRAGDLPQVLCMVAYVLDENLRHVRTVRLWRGEFGRAPPFDIGPDTLFVAYAAWAELICFMTLGWRFPHYVFDQHTAYLATSNILRPHNPDEVYKRPRKGLSDACRAYGIEGWEQIDKEVISKAIGEGHWPKFGREAVLAYCEEDVKKSVELLWAQVRVQAGLAPVDVERVIWWSEYSSKCVAQIQARGMLIDTELWWQVQEHKEAIIGELLRQFDPSYGDEEPIFTPDGHWSDKRFVQYLIRRRVTAWPRLDSGKPDLDSDAFRLMYHVPGIAGLHALRDSIGVIVRAKLPIGHDGRNRPSLFPFCTATGRNAHAKSLFNAHASMRSFMVAPPDRMLVYLDWRAQEIGVVAALSGDRALMDAYLTGDVYHAFARLMGLTKHADRKYWKANFKDQRQQMKSLSLGVNYGLTVGGLAKGLNCHPLIASGWIEQFSRLFPVFWQWRADQVQQAMLARRMETVHGWALHISSSPNKRALMNFPAQGNGAEMLRLATIRLCEAGLIPTMLIHDGILLELQDARQIEEAAAIMRAAARDVCNGFEIGADVDQQLNPGARFCDKRDVAQKMWATVMNALMAARAMPKRRA